MRGWVARIPGLEIRVGVNQLVPWSFDSARTKMVSEQKWCLPLYLVGDTLVKKHYD